MKPIICAILLVVCLKCAAQKGVFDKLIVNYGHGRNSWVIPGPYATEEQYEFTLTKAGGYKLSSDLKFEFSLNEDRAEVIDTIAVRFRKYKVSKELIDSLYAQFSITKPNFTYAFIRPLLKTPSKREILAVARKIHKHFKFEDYDRQELAERIKPIQSFDKVDYFINLKRPDPRYFSVTIDVGESATVSFIKHRDTTIFHCDLMEVLGQPILKRREDHRFVGTQFVNLEVNVLLEGILPISSYARKRIGINSITDDYIRWYIDKVL